MGMFSDFGGHDPRDEPILADADPQSLLDEIAECARLAKPMRPELARWFWRAHRDGLIRVTGSPGRPGAAAEKDLLDATMEVLSRDDVEDPRSTSEVNRMVATKALNAAIKEVLASRGLESAPATIKMRLYAHWDAEREIIEGEIENERQLIVSKLSDLKSRGITGGAAIVAVWQELELVHHRNESALQALQDDAHADPVQVDALNVLTQLGRPSPVDHGQTGVQPTKKNKR